jgi:membrane-bound lytic murein transglycosylase B
LAKSTTTWLAAATAWWLWAGAAAATDPEQAFIADVVSRHGFDPAWVERTLDGARHDARIIAAITRPAEAMPWHRYRRIFLTDDRIEGGVDYWRKHAATLRAAQEAFGVPPHVITAIIGVETRYGAHTGKYRVADALKTLGFGYPPRADFFRKELEQFLLMAREEGMDPLDPLGSYAGAMGQPQFIASSFRAYAVDFDNDGRRDLWDSDADVVGSVANYLARHGWTQGAPVAIPVSGDAANLAALASGGSKPDRTLAEIVEAGVALPDSVDPGRPAVVIELQQEDGPEFWAGFDNFYVITRYNHSNLYAMAVFQLAEAIRERHAAGDQTPQ